MSNFWPKKLVAVAEEIWVVVAYERALEMVFNWKSQRFSLQSGHLREVVAMRELTLITLIN